MRLWDKGNPLDERVLNYTVGDDHILDLRLIAYDLEASRAHARMLHTCGYLDRGQLDSILGGLDEIGELDRKGEFTISRAQEDCHTAIEEYLTEHIGQAGKMLHTGRSRNDQVLTALRLHEKDHLEMVRNSVKALMKLLEERTEEHTATPFPGYTHMRKAMPTTVGTWLGSYRAALADDLVLLEAVSTVIDASPLGTAAGFGVPVLKIDREMSAREMGFSRVMENPMYAQHSRGKFEAMIVHALSQIMLDLNRLSSDMVTFSMEQFGYIRLPPELCTGSSIMPQKVNPDVLELIRGSYHVMVGEETKLRGIGSDLISGYHRDLQLTKGPLMRSFDLVLRSLDLMTVVVRTVQVDADACSAAITEPMLATQHAYELVEEGVPFRDAYRRVARGHGR